MLNLGCRQVSTRPEATTSATSGLRPIWKMQVRRCLTIANRCKLRGPGTSGSDQSLQVTRLKGIPLDRAKQHLHTKNPRRSTFWSQNLDKSRRNWTQEEITNMIFKAPRRADKYMQAAPYSSTGCCEYEVCCQTRCC